MSSLESYQQPTNYKTTKEILLIGGRQGAVNTGKLHPMEHRGSVQKANQCTMHVPGAQIRWDTLILYKV